MINLWYEDNHLRGRMNGPLKVIINLKESLESGLDYSVNENRYKKTFSKFYDKINSYTARESVLSKISK